MQAQLWQERAGRLERAGKAISLRKEGAPQSFQCFIEQNERLQEHLGDRMQLAPLAQAEADRDPARAAALAFLADVWGIKSGGIPGLNFGLGGDFYKAAWEGERTDSKGWPLGPNPLGGFGKMIRGAVATVIEFNNPFPPELEERNRRT